MGKDRYVAYVGTYTHGSSVGVHVYDMDVEAGYMTERNVVPVNNASHLTTSTNGKYLYSIADEGVEVLKINQETGDLTAINKVGIDGIRGESSCLWPVIMMERLPWCIPIAMADWAA